MVLLTSLTFLIPDTIIQSLDFSAVVNSIPKVSHDFKYLMQSQHSVVANRYVFEYLLCLVLFFPVLVYSLIYSAEGSRLKINDIPNSRVMLPTIKRLRVRFFALLFFIYFLFFEQWVAGSTVRIARGIYDNQFFIVFLPLLFVSLTNTTQLAAQDYFRVYHATEDHPE